jgi:hypothetical protein
MLPANPLAGTVSLVIAISGHCDLYPEDTRRFEDTIRGIFRGLGEKYPNTPLVLLSGLAEGADRIAVKAAMAESVSYVAVLPMPAAAYRADFTSEASDTEFEELRTREGVRSIELPLVGDSTIEEVSRDGEARDKQYEQLGEFLVNYSQILIAVWDGVRTGKKGGTGEVVAMKLRERTYGRIAFSWMNSNGAGPVYILPARRISSGADAAPALELDLRYPGGSKPGDYEASYKLQDQFNKDVASAGGNFGERVETSRRELVAGANATGLSEAMKWVARVYSRADALAMRYQKISLRLWKTVFVLLGLGGMALAWGQTMKGGLPFLAGYWACLVVAWRLARWELKEKRRNKHEDYRAFAEALRVQFFWMAAGLEDLAAAQYLRKHAGEMVWIRDAMSECRLYEGVLEHHNNRKDNRAQRLGLARNWVEGQASFFLTRSAERKAAERRLSSCAWTAAGLGLIAPVFGYIPPLQRFVGEWPATAAVVMAWCGAMIWTYVERRGYAQEARQYARMYELFSKANEDLKKFEIDGSFDEAEKTIRTLGGEALAENGDWLAMHRERTLPVRPA